MTPQTERLMALADRYAFHIPGSQHSDEARAALLAALHEQAPEADCATTGVCVRSGLYAAPVQAREGEAVVPSAILARGRFHFFKGEDGEPDDWEWFEEGTNCEHGCIDAVIVRADALSAPQPAQPDHTEQSLDMVAQPEQGERADLYSLDRDTEGIRARVVHAVLGVLAFGARNENKPPADHWLSELWEVARAERERKKFYRQDAMNLRDELNSLRELQSAQPVEARLPKFFVGTDMQDGVLTVSVLQREPDGVAVLVHHEEITVSAQPVAQPLPLTDAWIRERTTQPWIFETVKQWVKEIEAAHGIGGAR